MIALLIRAGTAIFGARRGRRALLRRGWRVPWRRSPRWAIARRHRRRSRGAHGVGRLRAHAARRGGTGARHARCAPARRERRDALLRRARAPVADPLARIARSGGAPRASRSDWRSRPSTRPSSSPSGSRIAVLLRPSLRARLREPGPYVACVLATLVFLPVLHWNATHDWISFLFQIQHGLGTPQGSALQRELELVGGQLGLVSPILFVLAAAAVWRAATAPRTTRATRSPSSPSSSWAFFVYSASAPSRGSQLAGAVVRARRRAPRRGRDRSESRATLAAARHRARRRAVAVMYCSALVPLLPATKGSHRARCRVGARSAAGGGRRGQRSRAAGRSSAPTAIRT